MKTNYGTINSINLCEQEKQSIISKYRFPKETNKITIVLCFIFLVFSLNMKAQNLKLYPNTINKEVFSCEMPKTQKVIVENTGTSDLVYTCHMEVASPSEWTEFEQITAMHYGNAGMAYANNFLFFLNDDSYVFMKFDLNKKEIIGTYKLPFYPRGMAYDGQYLWIGDNDGNIYNYDLFGEPVGDIIKMPFEGYSVFTFIGENWLVGSQNDTEADLYEINSAGIVLDTIECSNLSLNAVSYIEGHTGGEIWIVDGTGYIHQASIESDTLDIIKSNPNDYNSFIADVYTLAHNGSDLLVANYVGPVYIVHDGNWENNTINLSTENGVVAPGTVDTIDFVFSPASLYTGTYSGTLFFESNDPLNPNQTIPFTFNYTGEGIAQLSANYFNYGDIALNRPVTKELLVTNSGCEQLIVSNISNEFGVYTTDISAFSLDAGESQIVNVTFTPIALSVYNDTLVIEHSSGTSDLYLQGMGVDPALMSVSVDTLQDTLYNCNLETNKNITLSNLGSSELEVLLAVDDSITIVINSGGYPDEVSWDIKDINGIVYASGSPYTLANEIYEQTIYMSTGTYTFNAYDGYGDGWNGGSFTILLRDEVIISDAPNGSFEAFPFSVVNFGIELSTNEISIGSAESEEVIVTARAENFAAGDYSGRILISSNDPNKELDTVYYELTVQGDAQLSLIENSIDFEEVYFGSSSNATISLVNLGCGNLSISNFANSLTDFTVGIGATDVYAYDTLIIPIQFTPGAAGNFVDTIVIVSNLDNDTIFVSGSGINPPVNIVSSSLIQDTLLACNGNTTKTFYVKNTGEADLVYNVDITSLGNGSVSKDYYYNQSGDTINSVFEYQLEWTDSIEITILLDGDYTDHLTEFATLFIEGVNYGVINNEDIEDWNLETFSFVFSNGEVQSWLDDGQIEITVINSIEVDPNIGNQHVQIGINNFYTDYLTLDVDSGILSAGDSAFHTLTFNGQGLVAEIFNRNIYVNSNDPDNGSELIEYEMVLEGVSEELIEAAIDFGSIINTVPAVDTLWLVNFGCDTLSVTDITGASAEFSVNTTTIDVPAYDSAYVLVTFAPPSSGTYSTTLSIEHTNGTSTVDLSGEGVATPEMSVSPLVINESLTGCDALSTAIFTIANAAGSDLEFSTEIFNNYHQYISKSYTVNGAVLNYNFTGLAAMYDSVIIQITLNGDYTIHEHEYATLNFESGTFVELINIEDTPDGSNYLATYRLSGEEIESNLADGQLDFQVRNSIDVDPGVGDQTVSIEVWGKNNTNINISPETGVVVVGASQDVTISFDASLVDVNAYIDSILILSNDLNNPSDTVHFTFDYQGAPSIQLSTVSVDFGNMYLGYPLNETVQIINNGCDTLEVTNISGLGAAYTVNSTSFTIWPKDTANLIITYDAPSAGTYDATVNIINNDTPITLLLSGGTTTPPEFSIDKLAIETAVTACGGSTTESFTVSNVAGDDLEVSISPITAEWLSISQDIGTIIGGNNIVFELTFNTIDLVAGIYTYEVIVNSNDPANNADTVVCTFTYSGESNIVFSDIDFAFPDVFNNDSAYAVLTVSNPSCDTLKVTSINSDNVNFYTDEATIEVLAGESEIVVVRYKPTELGYVSGNILFQTNYKDTSISVSGTGIYPIVTGISSETLDGVYSVGDVIEFVVDFNNEIAVTTTGGTPQIELNTSPVAYATYASGSDTRNLVFEYTVGSADNISALDYTTVNALTLEGGVFADDLGNTPSIELPAVGTFSSMHQIGIDNIHPQGVFAALTSNPTSQNPIAIEISFDEGVEGVEVRDFVVTNGMPVAIEDDETGENYIVYVEPDSDGLLTIDLPANSLQDLAGNGNIALTQYLVTYDGTIPVLTLSTSETEPTNANPFVVTIESNVEVTGLELADIIVTNGSASNLTEITAGFNWTVEIASSQTGDVNIVIPIGAVENLGAVENPESVSLVVNYDGTSPSILFETENNPTNVSSVFIDIIFSEPVTGFSVEDIVISNADLLYFGSMHDGINYTLKIAPLAHGNVMIYVAGDAVFDQAGNGNEEQTYNLSYDLVAPVVNLSCASADITNDNPIIFNVNFNEQVTGFTIQDITLGNGNITGFNSSDNRNWIVTVVPNADGNVSMLIGSGVAQDLMGYNNSASLPITRLYDGTVPEVDIIALEGDTINASPFNIEFNFSEGVSDFIINDIIVTNGVASNLTSVSADKYAVVITPDTVGVVSVMVGEGAVVDVAANLNLSSTKELLFDNVAPQVALAASDTVATNDNPIIVEINFGEVVSGFELSDVQVENGSADSLQVIIDSVLYSVQITPASNGEVIISIADNVVVDIAQNSNKGSSLDIIYDGLVPQIMFSTTDTLITNEDPIVVEINFSELVSGFDLSDIQVSNGTFDSLKVVSDSLKYLIEVKPITSGELIVAISDSVVIDVVGNYNTSAVFSIVFDGLLPAIGDLMVSSITNIGATANINSNKAGTLFYILQLQDETAPTAGEILSGVGSSANAAIVAGNVAVDANTTKSVPITDLNTNTAYILYVVLEDQFNSVSDISSELFTTLAVGIDGETNVGLSVYPNPVATYFTIELDSKINADYLIYNVDGKAIIQGEIFGGKTEVDLSSVVQGTYMLVVKIDDKLRTFNLVKE